MPKSAQNRPPRCCFCATQQKKVEKALDFPTHYDIL
jgi:hypothetical protein